MWFSSPLKLQRCPIISKLFIYLKWSYNMCTSGRLGLVVGFGFGLGWYWGNRKSKRWWSSKVGTRFTSVAEKLHFWSTVVDLSWRVAKSSWSSGVDWGVAANGCTNGWGFASVWLRRRHCYCTLGFLKYFFLLNGRWGFVVWYFLWRKFSSFHLANRFLALEYWYF